MILDAMLEKPDIQEEKIIACAQAEFGLGITRAEFLPLGADQNTALYRLADGDGAPYLLKLRRDDFNETAVALPKYLSEQGVAQVIAPLAARRGRLFTEMGRYKAVLYPFIEGRDGYRVELSERHWGELGAAMRRMHSLAAPEGLTRAMPRESYSERWRGEVKSYLARLDVDA
ncbi:MAG: aminoglycoside phosphotransferase family protein, partial [Chloroflexi bacterium]|nr:aminoglycoside phosphotransferase family protein [Chloroflexota bacterium]